MSAPPSPTALPDAKSFMPTGALVLGTGGIIMVVLSLIMQIFSLSHGSSGQLTIDSALNTNLWVMLTGVFLFIVGYILYLVVGKLTPQTKYLAMYILAFSAFFLSNLAMMFSTMQVTVTTSQMGVKTLYTGYFLAVAGILTIFISSVIPVSNKQKLKQKEFGLQIFLPSILGLLAYLVGTYFIFTENSYSDEFFQFMIPITAAGGIIVSLVSIINSYLTMIWAASQR